MDCYFLDLNYWLIFSLLLYDSMIRCLASLWREFSMSMRWLLWSSAHDFGLGAWQNQRRLIFYIHSKIYNNDSNNVITNINGANGLSFRRPPIMCFIIYICNRIYSNVFIGILGFESVLKLDEGEKCSLCFTFQEIFLLF